MGIFVADISPQDPVCMRETTSGNGLTHCSHLAVLGALITIAAIAIDPFTQRLIHPVLCDRVTLNSGASIPRAQNLTGGYSMVSVMSDAFVAGLLTDQQLLSYDCPTGNCTYPSMSGSTKLFQTLGFDSACVDISEEIVKRDEQGKAWQWSMPRLEPDSMSVSFDNITRTLRGYSKLLDRIGGRTYYNKTVLLKYWPEEGGADDLYRFALLTTTLDWHCLKNSVPDVDVTRSCQSAVAAECRLWPTVHTLKARVRLGTLEEEVVKSDNWLLHQDISDFNPAVFVLPQILRDGNQVACVPSTAPQTDTSVAVAVDKGALWRGQEYEKTTVVRWYPQDCVWVVDYDTRFALGWVLDNLFNRNVLTRYDNFDMDITQALIGDPWMRKLNHNSTATLATVETFVARLAESMTAYARAKSKRDQNPAYTDGVATRTETCIHVRWTWISFPASLVASTFLFLILIICRTHRQRHDHSSSERGAWKSSSLAVLFSGLDESVYCADMRIDTMSDMVRRAETTRVSLGLTDDGWRLGGTQNM